MDAVPLQAEYACGCGRRVGDGCVLINALCDGHQHERNRVHLQLRELEELLTVTRARRDALHRAWQAALAQRKKLRDVGRV